MKEKTFSISYEWGDFRNYGKLTAYQKHKIKNEYISVVEDAIQRIINQSIKDRTDRRDDLNSHNDPDHPFGLDMGGEG